jgi:hypothetical protein
MHLTATVDRVILVVADGLRPEAIDEFGLRHIAALRSWGASTMEAVTVSPSRSWPVLASLMTGVPPELHSIAADGRRPTAPRVPLKPIPRLLRRAGLPSSAFFGDVAPTYHLYARRVATRLGFSEVGFSRGTAIEIVLAARETLECQRQGLVVLHLPDADAAGHRHGWMSPRYGEAAKRVDAAIGWAAVRAAVPGDPRSLLIVLADHGGGGVYPHSHGTAHALDCTVPLIIAGGPVAVASKLAPAVSLLDVPPTILYSLGLQRPATYVGSPLQASFDGATVTWRAA